MNWLIKIFFEKLFVFIADLFGKEVAAQKRMADQKAKDLENSKKLTDATNAGATKEEIAKKAEDLLNGD
jgi:hypothetical protein